MKKIRLKESLGVSDEHGQRVYEIGAVIDWPARDADRLVQKNLAEYVADRK